MDGSSPSVTADQALDEAPDEAAPGLIARPSRAAPVADRPLGPALRHGWAKRCPRCGQGRLFEGYLKVTRACPSCGEDLTPQRADDGPAYLTILLVGHIIAVLMHFGWSIFRPEPLVFASTLTVIAVAMSLWLLPRIKGGIVAFQWSRRMHGFGRGDAASD